jgi:hypothetical protein
VHKEGSPRRGQCILFYCFCIFPSDIATSVPQIKQSYRPFLYHKWIHAMSFWQEKLDVATFPDDDIIVKTDFAAAAELAAKWTSTCEWPTSAQQDVALVLHSPGKLDRNKPGQPRPVKCDYVRAFSNAKPSYQFHHMLMRDIAHKYKFKVPLTTKKQLKRMRVKSDGCRFQYKGRGNFFRLVLVC